MWRVFFFPLSFFVVFRRRENTLLGAVLPAVHNTSLFTNNKATTVVRDTSLYA
jgi:hypothetical protein